MSGWAFEQARYVVTLCQTSRRAFLELYVMMARLYVRFIFLEPHGVFEGYGDSTVVLSQVFGHLKDSFCVRSVI